MCRTLGLAAALVGLVALAMPSQAFTTSQSGAVNTASQSRVADPDDLMQNMLDEQSSGTVTLPGGSGALHFNGGANAPGGANSPFLPSPNPGPTGIPAQH